MFALREYLEAACPAVPVDLPSLRSRVYRFPGSIGDLRLPKDPSVLSVVLDGPEGDGAWSALSAPQGRVPLVAPDGRRRVALLSAVTEDQGVALARVTLTVIPPTGKFGQPDLAAATVDVVRGRDAQVSLLTALWAEAEPAARAAAGGAPAVWLGNDSRSPASPLLEAVRALGAVYGLDVEVVRDAHRRSREVAVRLAQSPPAYVLTWTPYAAGCEGALAAYEAASEEGEVIRLVERGEGDVLLELGLHLDDRGLAEPAPEATPVADPPGPGEERFFIKGRGSKVGDVMIAVPDCGHSHWGSDVRRLAPRAYKGIWAQQAAPPRALFRCEKCTKHRWRARW
jgi:hypothetical protein